MEQVGYESDEAKAHRALARGWFTLNVSGSHDFLEQYKKNWIHIDKESKGILKVIREVEEQGQETESQNSSIINQISDSSTSKTSKDEEKKPLSYYL